MKILTWMWDNRQWLFSGAGFIVAAGFFRFLVSLSNRKRKIEVVLSHGFPTYSDHAGPVSLACPICAADRSWLSPRWGVSRVHQKFGQEAPPVDGLPIVTRARRALFPP